MDLIKEVLESMNMKKGEVPILDKFRHRLLIGATRAISYIVYNLEEDGFVKSYSIASGASDTNEHLETHTWIVAWRKEEDNPPRGEKNDES